MIALGFQPATPRPLVLLTALSAALLLVLLTWSLADTRLIAGAPVWAKPVKFALSFVMLFGTMALVEARLSDPWRNGRLLRGTVTVMGAAMMFEMAYMVLQAAQGQASHFNFSSAYTIVMYQVMGVGALSLIAGVALFGMAALRDSAARLERATRLGVGLGFALSCVLTLITAGTMSSLTGHYIGTPGLDAATLPLLGWSASVGDLRPAHFLSLHAMQALPLTGLWLDRQQRAVGLIWPVAGVYVTMTAVLFVQALMGLPLIRL